MKTKLLALVMLISLANPAWSGSHFGLGSAVAQQSGHVIKEEKNIAAASSLPACTDQPIYTVSPLNTALGFNMEPLGHLSGSSHLFPTDHIYFILPKATDTVVTTNVYAPGDIRIYSVAVSEYLNASPVFSDYALRFSPCQGLRGLFGHVAELSPALAEAIGNVNQNCFTYSDGSVHYCSKEVAINVAAGDLIGTIKGRVGSSIYSLDLGAYDYRKAALALLDPTRRPGDYLYTRCPIDEYDEPLKTNLLSRMGNYDGSLRRTQAPVCGTVLEDVAGTAQGLWYVSGTPLAPVQLESPHLALVHDNVTPSTGVFSIGTVLATAGSVGSQQYYFNPTTAGLVNLDFNLVNSLNTIYCYDSISNLSNTIFLVQLPTATTLKVEIQTAASCGAGPWAFSGNAVSFER